MTNIYMDISHIGENTCGLCGTQKNGGRSSFHRECRWRLDNLRAFMKAKRSEHFDEAAFRYQVMQENADWLLRLKTRDLRARIGEKGQDAVMLFDMERRRDV